MATSAALFTDKLQSLDPVQLPIQLAPSDPPNVFVDDFMLLGQGTGSPPGIALRRHLMHCCRRCAVATYPWRQAATRPSPSRKCYQATAAGALANSSWAGSSTRCARPVELPPSPQANSQRHLLGTPRCQAASAPSAGAASSGRLRFVSRRHPRFRWLVQRPAVGSEQGRRQPRQRLNAFVRSNLDAFARLASSL